MSTTDNTPATDAESQEQFKKDVVIIAYGDGEYGTKREFIADTVGQVSEKDVLEEKTTTNRVTKLEIDIEEEIEDGGFTRTINQQFVPHMKSEKDLLAETVDEDELPDWMTFEDKEVTDTTYVTDVQTVIRDLIRNLFGEDELTHLGYEEPNGHPIYGATWSKTVEDQSVDADPDDEITLHTRVRSCHRGDIQQRRKLVHQSERSRDNRYAGDEEFWSFQVTAHLEALSEEELDQLSSEIVPKLYGELASIPNISTVRLSDCQKKVKRQGECYGL